ncbi:MAG: HAD family hydrolase [Collinsella sp.]
MIVFSDMDGTLLTSDKQMSDATWAMLDELARRGVEFVPCTGARCRASLSPSSPIPPYTTRSAPTVPASGSSTPVRPPILHVLRAF